MRARYCPSDSFILTGRDSTTALCVCEVFFRYVGIILFFRTLLLLSMFVYFIECRYVIGKVIRIRSVFYNYYRFQYRFHNDNIIPWYDYCLLNLRKMKRMVSKCDFEWMKFSAGVSPYVWRQWRRSFSRRFAGAVLPPFALGSFPHRYAPLPLFRFYLRPPFCTDSPALIADARFLRSTGHFSKMFIFGRKKWNECITLVYDFHKKILIIKILSIILKSIIRRIKFSTIYLSKFWIKIKKITMLLNWCLCIKKV